MGREEEISMTGLKKNTTMKHDPIPEGSYKETTPMETTPMKTTAQSTSDAAIDKLNEQRWVPISMAIKLTGLSESYFYKLMRDGQIKAMSALSCEHPLPRGIRRTTLVIDVNGIPYPHHLTRKVKKKMASGKVRLPKVEAGRIANRISRLEQLEEEYVPVPLITRIIGLESSALYRAIEHGLVAHRVTKLVKLSDARRVSDFIKHRRADKQ
jgi:predicted DNA-binding transcriptional regulator AlpA